MKTSRLIGALCAVIFAVITMSSHAALVGRDLDGNLTTAEAYYDTDANLTWLANANAAGTTMSWANANAWAAGLDIDGTAGADGWRLPASDTCVGYNCTGSEMGNLFYNVLGNTAGSLSNTGPFSNVQSAPTGRLRSTRPIQATRGASTSRWLPGRTVKTSALRLGCAVGRCRRGRSSRPRCPLVVRQWFVGPCRFRQAAPALMLWRFEFFGPF